MIMLLIAYVQCGANETKYVKSIILFYHTGSDLFRET